MNKKFAYLIFTIVIGIISIIYALDSLILRPWFGIPELGLDAIKNIFVYLFHSHYEQGVWSQALNYPYGEHIVYLDGLPLFSIFFSNFLHVDYGTALTVLWWAIGFNYILAIVYVHLILNRFAVKPLISIIFSCLIIMLSPQFFRLGGHFGLSFVCYIPMLFYWTICYFDNAQKKYALYIFFSGLIFALLHPYYLALMVIWSFTYAGWYLILIKNQLIVKLKHIIPIISSALCVFVLFNIFIKFTDPVNDRPITPMVSNENFSDVLNIFSSDRSSISTFLQQNKLIGSPTFSNEGYCYIGLISALVIVVSAIMGLIYLIARKKNKLIVYESYFPPIWIAMAIFIFILSMGIPFVWNIGWFILDVNPLRQFRSLGRFSWLFYYIMTIYAVVLINRWYVQLNKIKTNWIGSFIVYTAILIWGAEVIDYTKYSKKIASISEYNYDVVNACGQKSWVDFLKEKKYKKDDFQAVLLWGLINSGTDKYVTGINHLWLTALGDICCLQLHLPAIESILARSSWGAARKQLRLSAGPFVEKQLLHDIPNRKPFLLIQLKDSKFNPDEMYIFDACDYIGEFNDCKVFSFNPDRQLSNDKKWHDSIVKLTTSMNCSDTCIGDNTNFFIDHLDKNTNIPHYFGRGGCPYPSKKDSLITVFNVENICDTTLYEFSTWFLYRKSDFFTPIISLIFYDSSGKILNKISFGTLESYDNDELWSRMSTYFHVPNNCKRIAGIIDPEKYPSFVVFDEAVFRPSNSITISKCNDKYMVNNHLFVQ